MNWPNWVLDVTWGSDPRCFCPIEDDGSVVLGMNFISERPPGKVVGCFHSDGHEAVQAWLAENEALMNELTK